MTQRRVTTVANFIMPDQQESIQPTMGLQTDPAISIVGQNESSEITLLQGLGLHSQTHHANSSHAGSQRILRITLNLGLDEEVGLKQVH
jgi:hypothetical protein